MGFSKQEYWSGLPFPSPEDLPDPGIKPRSPALQADSLPSELQGRSKAGAALPQELLPKGGSMRTQARKTDLVPCSPCNQPPCYDQGHFPHFHLPGCTHREILTASLPLHCMWNTWTTVTHCTWISIPRGLVHKNVYFILRGTDSPWISDTWDAE